jgi:Domain of unknown function (DUF4832)
MGCTRKYSVARKEFLRLVNSSDTKPSAIEAMYDQARIAGSRHPQTVATATGLAVLALAACLAMYQHGEVFANGSESLRSTRFMMRSIGTPARSSGGSGCETEGKHQILISCDYVAAETVSKKGHPVIVLNHATISFEANHESHFHVELTFTQRGTTRFAGERSGYIAINSESGQNYVRRVLPHLNFRKLTPGVAATFSDEFLAPALQPGRYRVQLWIPDPNPALKFDAASSFLLSNAGVPDQTTGLNTIATIVVLQ